jgi:hypothetical protein
VGKYTKMPYVPGVFDDSDSDVAVITYTPSPSDKHISPEHKRAGEVQFRMLLELEEEISLCMMSMGTIEREDPDYTQITQRLEALHGEYQKALDDSYDDDDINDLMIIGHDAQTPAKQPLPSKKKVKKWNTVKLAPRPSRQPHHQRNGKPATKAIPPQLNTSRTVDGQYNHPWFSLTEPEKARHLAPLSRHIIPTTERESDNKAAPTASIPYFSDLIKARSASLVDTAAIAEPKNKPTARADEDNDQGYQQRKGTKWSTVEVKSTGKDTQTGAARSGASTGFKNPGLSPVPQWADQVSPELKTFEQVHDQMREQPQQTQVEGSDLPANFLGSDTYVFHRLMGIPFGPDAPPYVPPTPDIKAVAIMSQVEELAKTLTTQNEATGSGRVPSHEDQVQMRKGCDDSWGPPCGGCSNCTSVDAHPSWDAAGEGDWPVQNFWDAQATSTVREENQLQQSAQVTTNSPIIKLEDLPEAIRDELYQQFLAETEPDETVFKKEKPAAASENVPLPNHFWDEIHWSDASS